MSKQSDWKTGQYFKWCTELPNTYKSPESPIFVFQGAECYFQFRRHLCIDGFLSNYEHCIYLKQKNSPKTKFKPFSLEVHAAPQRLCDVDVTCRTISYTETCSIWSISEEDLQSIAKPNFYSGFQLKLLFIFDSDVTPFQHTKSETDEKSVQTSSPLSCLEYLSDDFSKLLDGGVACDVTLKCGEATIEAHRTVIGARSRVFAAMLASDMVEGRTGLVELEQTAMDAELFRDFVSHLYSGAMPELTEDRAAKLYDIGDKYAVEGLKRQSAEFLTDHLTPENACECLVLADGRSDREFKEGVLAYILENKIPLLAEQWMNFCRDRPQLANEVLNRYYQLTNRA